MKDHPNRFVPEPERGTRYYRSRRSRDLYKSLEPALDQDEEARAAFEDGKPVRSGFTMKVDWATGECEWIFSSRTTEKEHRNAIIEVMNYPNRVETTIDPSDHPSTMHREIFGHLPRNPDLEGRRGRYAPPD